ncbi:DUF7649 domain-containing protein [Carnobacterium gallinarum]|uniref:DUF7649 domain-containing protein n=1 Tax=Carnobacterium gallinarum TaxID=2749 RepID=UPI00054F3E4E|nr:hypothetical protein [Carnobacterium gallinarum]
MSRNLRVLLVIEGFLAISFIRDLIGNPLVVTLLIGAVVLMVIGNRDQNKNLGKVAIYIGLSGLALGAFTSGVAVAMLIIILMWGVIFGFDEMKYEIQKRI